MLIGGSSSSLPRIASSSSILIIVVSVFIVIRFLFPCNELSARCSSYKKKWIVSLNGERVNSHRRSTSKTISWCHIMALENSYSVWIWRTWKIDQLVLISLTWKQINFFSIIWRCTQEYTRYKKGWYDCLLIFHETLIVFWFYFIFPFILFHRFSMTQNKSDDRINKKTLTQESINFLYTFTRGKKISVSFIWFTYNVVLLF